uniref:L antigen family member 3 n=1 Tax=Pelusios castaneus TaxID=367368 RepID=A0A8C8S597_9SAUR
HDVGMVLGYGGVMGGEGGWEVGRWGSVCAPRGQSPLGAGPDHKLRPRRQHVGAEPSDGGSRSRLPLFLNFPPSTLRVPFPSPLEAQIAHGSLAPDPEPHKGGDHIPSHHISSPRHWKADEARILRVSINSFLDHLALVIQTMEMFGPPVPR